MFEKQKAKRLFQNALGRPDIEKAYQMVGPEDSWYNTIKKVHDSLAEIQTLPHEIWEMESHDHLQMKAVYYPGHSDKTMIWVHGYTSHAERESAFPGLFYHSLGFNVLIPYLRAHGPSEGQYISFGALEHDDMLRWVEQVNLHSPNGQILIHGLSMGGGIVLDLATKEMENVKCLVVDAPSENVESTLRGMTGHRYKQKAVRIYPHVRAKFIKEFGCDPADFDRTRTIAFGRYPMLLSAGEREACEKLFRMLKYQNPAETEVLILPGCDHGNGMYKQTEMYHNALREFIDKYMENGLCLN